MTKKEPFLDGFPTTLCGRPRQSFQAWFERNRHEARVRELPSYALQFERILPRDFLADLADSRRDKGYSDPRTFWTLTAMMLEGNAGLPRGVTLLQSWRREAGLKPGSSGTASLSKARSRLSEEFIDSAHEHVVAHLEARITPEDKWRGLVVKSLDGSSVQLMDTPENQQEYPQPSSQKPGCGFPVMAICGVLNHAHGGWEKVVCDHWKRHDASMATELMDCFGAGDLVVGDRAFGSWEMKARLRAQGAHGLFRLHQKRHAKLDFRRGQRLGPDERLVTWEKPRHQPKNSALGAEAWAALPEALCVRLIRVRSQDRAGQDKTMYLSTTLLDPDEHPAEEVAEIYRQRWDIELSLRDVKTTMGLEFIAAKSPEVARKSLKIGLMACNLVRATIQEAAHSEGLDLRGLSFKGALQAIVGHSPRWLRRQRQVRKSVELWEEMIEVIATRRLVPRPGRSEPHALKRRPKPFSFLTSPRSEYTEIPHRGKRRKAA